MCTRGNGTASHLRDDPSVFTLSPHGEKNFPFRRVAGDLDDGAARPARGDQAYLDALDLALVEAGQPLSPPMPCSPGGADLHGRPPGRLKLSYDGLLARDRRVRLGLTRRCR